jgi:hypothetical protein
MASNKKIVTLVLITLVGLAFTGCSDNDSQPTAAVIDTAPPALPSNVNLDYSDGMATISWDVNTVDTDLAGYIVMRERNDVSVALVAAPAMIQSYTDPNPPVGTSQYHVYAVDTAGNESAVSTTYLTVTQNHLPDYDVQ